MATTTTAALRRFAEAYARVLHFFVSIAGKSLYDQLDELFETRPELWSKEKWLFDVQDVFVDSYGDATVMNGLWEVWTRDYDRRLALLEGLPFPEKELVLQKLSTLCMRTPQTIDDVLRLKARAHYAIKIITRTLLPTLSEKICKWLFFERERLRTTPVEMKSLLLLPPIIEGALLRRRRNPALGLFLEEIIAAEKLNLDMTKRIFYLGQRAKAAIAARAEISRRAVHPPGIRRKNTTYIRIPASEFRADDERISRTTPPRSGRQSSSTQSNSTPRQSPAPSQVVPARAGTAPLLPIHEPVHLNSKTVMKQPSASHPPASTSQAANNGRKTTSSHAPTRGGLTAQDPRRPSSAASVHAPHRQVFRVDHDNISLAKTSGSTTTHSTHIARASPLESQTPFHQRSNTAASSSSSSYTNHFPLAAVPRNPLVEANRDSAMYKRTRPEVPSDNEIPARARTAAVSSKNIEAMPMAPRPAPSVHQSAPDDDKGETMVKTLRQARLDPSDCIIHDPTSIIFNKDNKNICFIHRNGTDTTIIRVLSIRTETDPTMQAHAIGGPYFDILWSLNPRLLRTLLQDSVHDNVPLVIERYQAGLIAKDCAENFRLVDETGVLNGEYFVQQNRISPEDYYYNVWMTVSRDRLKEYVAGFELAQKPDDV